MTILGWNSLGMLQLHIGFHLCHHLRQWQIKVGCIFIWILHCQWIKANALHLQNNNSSLSWVCIASMSLFPVFPVDEQRCCIAYHNILQRGFCQMHGSLLPQLKRKFDESNEELSATEYFQSSVFPSASNDMYFRALRVKAFKMFQWLSRKETVYELLMTAITVQPLERIMFVFLKWVEDGISLNADTSPVAIMASLDSPPRRAINQLIQLVISGRVLPDSDDSFTIAEFAGSFSSVGSE